MVLYNPKEWWRLIFAFHKSDTFRIMLPGIFAVAIYTGVVAFIENELFEVTFKNTTAIHALVGFVLSLLLVFRTNTAYDRWWDGRKLWGNVVNDCRNLALKLNAMLYDNQDKETFRILIQNYVYGLRDHLRDYTALNHLVETPKYPLSYYGNGVHIPNKIASAIYKETNQLLESKKISGEQLLFLNEQLQSLVNTVGACERIKNTPIPYSYNIFIKKVIFIYVFTMPIGFVREFGFWAMPIVAALFYVFASIELIAEEIEDPFGKDSNDLPLDLISKNVSNQLKEIFTS